MKGIKQISIKKLIYEIRGYQVMLDADLAGIYQVETKRLNEAVKRNIERFPPEFMFQLTDSEYVSLKIKVGSSNIDKSLRSQIATSKVSRGGRRYLPFVFTEHGIIMLSSVLNSKIATQINIAVVKAFIDMRRYITRSEKRKFPVIQEKIDNLEKILMLHIDDTNHNLEMYTATINEIITTLNNLIKIPPKPARKIGFQTE